MTILSMTATFGKLDNETLDLQPGLNILSAPNEWGKSTWCAFLTAMLYGVDTRERTTKEQLAWKERYQPWSGKPMSGTLRVLHQGRDITIQRRTRGRVPMGDFLAWETQTGLAVRELNAENCGQVLLGVEKSVFLRTGFLRFSDLPVTADENLRKRLNDLVTTGDESGSAEKLAGKLKELRNRCRHNQTGLIPECQSRISQLQEQLWERQSLQTQHDQLKEQVREMEQEMEALEVHRAALARKEAHDARTAATTAQRLAQSLEEKYADAPGREELEQNLRQGRRLLDELDLSIVEKPGSGSNLTLAALLAGAILIAVLLMMDRKLLIPCIVLGFALICFAGAMAGKRRRDQLWYSINQAQRQSQRTELLRSMEEWKQQLSAREDLEFAQEHARQTLQRLRELEAVLDPDTPQPEDLLTLSREETLDAITDLNHRLGRCRMQLGQHRGRMENLPDVQLLQTRLTQARRRLSELEKTQKALLLAQQALDTALRELQRRFAPDITARAGKHLDRLTGGVYDRITIAEDLSIQAARTGENTLRSALWRSEGTGDQMYLALRLAVWEVLAPGCPIILDDTLVRFDQTRMERAVDLLRDLARERQILLFSCQDREKEYMER